MPHVVPNASNVRFRYDFFLIMDMYELGRDRSTSSCLQICSSSRCASSGVCNLSRTRFASSMRSFMTSHRGVSGNIGSRQITINGKTACNARSTVSLIREVASCSHCSRSIWRTQSKSHTYSQTTMQRRGCLPAYPDFVEGRLQSCISAQQPIS